MQHSVANDHKNVRAQNMAQLDITNQTRERFKALSVIPYHIGKDFSMNIELGESPNGISWDPNTNTLTVDPQLLEHDSHDVARCSVATLGSHRRISRLEKEQIDQLSADPAYGLLLSTLLNSRAANFACHALPQLQNSIIDAEKQREGIRRRRTIWLKENLGFQPRYVDAINEYSRIWVRQKLGIDSKETIAGLPKDVRQIIEETSAAALDVTNYYPSKREAECGEEIIDEYARRSLEIFDSKVWPRFEELVEQDRQQGAISKWLQAEAKKQNQDECSTGKNISTSNGCSESKELSKLMNEDLSERQKQQLRNELSKIKSGNSKSVDFDNLDLETIDKLREAFNSLSDEQKQQLMQEAQDDLNQATEIGKEPLGDLKDKIGLPDSEETGKKPDHEAKEQNGATEFRLRALQLLHRDLTAYDEAAIKNRRHIKALSTAIKTEFRQRLRQRSMSGYSSGSRIHIGHRMQEIANGVPAGLSRAWIRTNELDELDYSFTLLADLSDSMKGEKVKRVFNASTIVTESLEDCKLPNEVLGFNSSLYELKTFSDKLDHITKEKIGSMVHSAGSCTDLGWAIDEASKRLQEQGSKNQVLVVLTDGEPSTSKGHDGEFYLVPNVLQRVRERGQIVIAIGLNIDRATMCKHFNSVPVIADVSPEQLTQVFAEVVEHAITGKKRGRIH